MIIKEKSIKSYIGMERALRYVLTKGVEDTGEILRRFITGDRPLEAMLELAENNLEEISIITEKRIANMMGQFASNDKNRLRKRKGETKFYHSILSFHKEDSLTPKQLKAVARKYAKERYPNSMVIALPHYDKEHLHVHSLASSVEVGTGKTRYLTRKEFAEVKERMEIWQEQKLGLQHSRVNHKKKAQSILKDAEYQLNLKGKLSEKQKLNMRLAEIYNTSTSQKGFLKTLSSKGMEVYTRNGRIAGLKGDKRKYRLKTLGFSKERLAELDTMNTRMKEIKKLNKNNSKDLER